MLDLIVPGAGGVNSAEVVGAEEAVLVEEWPKFHFGFELSFSEDDVSACKER